MARAVGDGDFARIHKSLANPYSRIPALAAGISDQVWTPQEIAGLFDSPSVTM